MSIYPNDYCHECQQTPSVEQPAPPDCAGEKCVEIYNAECIQYNGADIPCKLIEKGDRMDEVIHKLATCYNEEFVRGLLRMIRDDANLKALFAQIVCSINCGSITVCQVPAGLAVSSIGNTGATATWTRIAGVTGYYLEAAYTGSEGYVQLGGLIANPASGTTVSVNLSSLTASTDYLLRVKTVCSDGNESGWSTDVPFTTLTPTAPPTCDIPSTPTITFS